MKKMITTDDVKSNLKSGMLDQLMFEIYSKLKLEAEQLYSKDLDKRIRAQLLHQTISLTLALLANLADYDIYCYLNGYTTFNKNNLIYDQLTKWLDFKDENGIESLKIYFKDRAATAMKEEAIVKKGEEDCEDE